MVNRSLVQVVSLPYPAPPQTTSHTFLSVFAKHGIEIRSLRVSLSPLLIRSQGTPHLEAVASKSQAGHLASAEDKRRLLMECFHTYRKVNADPPLPSPLLTLLNLCSPPQSPLLRAHPVSRAEISSSYGPMAAQAWHPTCLVQTPHSHACACTYQK